MTCRKFELRQLINFIDRAQTGLAVHEEAPGIDNTPFLTHKATMYIDDKARYLAPAFKIGRLVTNKIFSSRNADFICFLNTRIREKIRKRRCLCAVLSQKTESRRENSSRCVF